ncbi:Enoyl-CoA hydratase/carnithine racemase [Pseudomonas flavescens]|uniref:Enoyl-CoA hydratase/carnithine racemase n=1 Tax=Phytopseudomonas flavescens TaxID=29435 RepID=A0A1G7Y3R1_9GAMM|nr:enoyl-CoA hydratase-related protein [Pseudomonas flavescens]SDG91039.1 Enoyl-CoA hydratase/carnithine racemase [Pseudomonas flavescens]
MSATVYCRIEDKVAVLTLSNPPLNVVTRELTLALQEHLDALAQQPQVRALVITGEGGKAFCAGSDIAEFAQWLEPGRIVPEKLALQHRVFGQLDHYPKPVVAALNGLTFGGGLEIALCCDLLVAESQVKLALPEIKLGVFPSSGGPLRVARRIGEARARELILLGEPIDAATALHWGLVNRVVATGDSLSAALALARQLAERPPVAYGLCKAVISASLDRDESQALAFSLEASAQAFASAECAEGVRAFLAKRTPTF